MNRWSVIGSLGLSLVTAICTSARAQLVSPSTITSAEESWPDDWYVRSGEGLEELRALEGKPAQELSLAEWRGESTTLAQLKGKIVVLDFWATWCGPCMAVIPKNVEFIKEYKDKGVALIGIHDAKAGWEDVDQVISEKGINYSVALDSTQDGNGVTTKAYALKFWPTYFVIDRDGIVRGAAIKPDKVHEVVDRLLSRSPVAANMVANKNGSQPDTWFLGGDKRLKAMRDREGKPAAKLAIAGWLGEEPDQSAWQGQVRIVQFVRPEISASVDQLTKVQAVAERFTRQGVVFVAVCDARSSRDKMQAVAEEKRIELPIAIDAPAESSLGATATSLGIKFAPTTVVIDRAGKVRAAGLKPDFLDKFINGLLVEPVVAAVEPIAPDEPTKPVETGEPGASSTNKSETSASETNTVTPTESAPAANSTSTNYAQRPDEGQPPAP